MDGVDGVVVEVGLEGAALFDESMVVVPIRMVVVTYVSGESEGAEVGLGAAVAAACLVVTTGAGPDAVAIGPADLDAELEGLEPLALEEGAGAIGPGAGAPPAGVTPHSPIGLLPGRAVKVPVIVSWMADGMLQVVESSLIPPIKPGHLSIPESPASQLSMIC